MNDIYKYTFSVDIGNGFEEICKSNNRKYILGYISSTDFEQITANNKWTYKIEVEKLSLDELKEGSEIVEHNILEDRR